MDGMIAIIQVILRLKHHFYVVFVSTRTGGPKTKNKRAPPKKNGYISFLIFKYYEFMPFYIIRLLEH